MSVNPANLVTPLLRRLTCHPASGNTPSSTSDRARSAIEAASDEAEAAAAGSSPAEGGRDDDSDGPPEEEGAAASRSIASPVASMISASSADVGAVCISERAHRRPAISESDGGL